MDIYSLKNPPVTLTHSCKWNENTACNSREFRSEECRKAIGQRRTVCCSYRRRLNTSVKCRHKSSGTSYSGFYTCLVGTILFTFWSGCTVTAARHKTPLIITDDSHGDGFRHFMRNVDFDEVPIGRSGLAPGLLYTADSLAFQTFKFISKWGNDTDILLLGGKDHVYMLDGKFADSGGDISYSERLTWRSQTRTRNECIMMPGQPEELCENFIRFIELMDNGELMVCGTNAYSPACRYYKREQFDERIYGEDSDYRDEKKCRGQCVVPHNPTTASVSLYTNTDNGYQMFAAAINGFMANDPIIMKKNDPTLLSNSLWLNEPTFLKIMEYREKVYIFFRETAEESESGKKEKVIYARVAQICKNDPGGINVLAHHWTSFLKARLRCGYSERQHLQFDNLTAVSDVVSLNNDEESGIDIFYATFATPWDWEDSSISAVCAFSMEEVEGVFERGRFFGEEVFELRPLSSPGTTGSSVSSETITKVTKSYPIPEDHVPSPRPGSCNLAYSPNALYFAKEHPLMYDGVMPLLFKPIYVIHDLRTTQIVVDNNAGGSGSGKHMIYIGTENGKVLRLRSMLQVGKSLKTVLIESISVRKEERCSSKHCIIRSFHIARPRENNVETKPSLFVAFTDSVVQLPLARCSVYRTKECCSVDLDCGWNGRECELRTSQNSARLLSTSRDADPLPEICSTGGLNEKCICNGKNSADCEKESINPDDGSVIDSDILDKIGVGHNLNLNTLMESSISSQMRRQFRDTVNTLRGDGQRNALRHQLTEAVASTVGLVLRNHKQEYCLPSLAVNHLTHVYPLLIREIELWHEMALKKMNGTDFDSKCWTTVKKCLQRVSFSLPLVPMLWEPLSKLIVNFSGRCRPIISGNQAAFRPRARSQCEPMPGLEPCKDIRQPHCRAERCQFPEYAVDVKAFFRHANDSRQFLKQGDVEPLWKPVNITLPSDESIRGHLEVIVSEDQPFLIDYSPVAEKVKIMFHYKPVKDCALTDSMCVGMVRGCDPEVEDVIDHWFKWVMSKMSHRMRRCAKEITRAKRKESRKRDRRRGSTGRPHDPAVQEGQGGWNRIPVTRDKCRRVVGKVRELTSQPVTRNIWSLIVSRCQRSGGIYSAFQGKIEFYSLQNVKQFFKSMCTFDEPSIERRTLKRRINKSRSRATVYIQPMVTSDTPFIIERNDGQITIKYFSMES